MCEARAHRPEHQRQLRILQDDRGQGSSSPCRCRCGLGLDDSRRGRCRQQYRWRLHQRSTGRVGIRRWRFAVSERHRPTLPGCLRLRRVFVRHGVACHPSRVGLTDLLVELVPLRVPLHLVQRARADVIDEEFQRRALVHLAVHKARVAVSGLHVHVGRATRRFHTVCYTRCVTDDAQQAVCLTRCPHKTHPSRTAEFSGTALLPLTADVEGR